MSESVPMTKRESDVVRRIADRDGSTEEETASRLVKAALERRVRRKTGKGPAKVYSMRRHSAP